MLVNGRLIGRLPRTPTVAVNPGRVEISVSLTGHESMREVRELTPGAHEKVDVRLQALVAGPLAIQDRAAPPPTSSWMRPTGVVVGAAGLLGVGSGVVLWFVADGKRDKIDSDAAAGRPYDPANGNWRTLGRASTVCLVAGGAAILAGGALWLLGRRDETTVAVAPTSDGVALQLGGIF